jgi:hypothetical protein
MKVSQLRVLQIVCLVVAVAACVMVARLGNPRGAGETGPIQWAICPCVCLLRSIGLYTAAQNYKRTYSIPRNKNTFHTVQPLAGGTFRPAILRSFSRWLGRCAPYQRRRTMVGVCALRFGNSFVAGMESRNRTGPRAFRQDGLSIRARNPHFFTYN